MGLSFSHNETNTPQSGYTKIVYGDGTRLVGYSAAGVGHFVPFHETDVSATQDLLDICRVFPSFAFALVFNRVVPLLHFYEGLLTFITGSQLLQSSGRLFHKFYYTAFRSNEHVGRRWWPQLYCSSLGTMWRNWLQWMHSLCLPIQLPSLKRVLLSMFVKMVIYNQEE